MSTRGTYKIDGTLCYNHWDNYPTGAAFHLLGVINKTNRTDLFSCIRGMERLELGSSIYDGPAEYYYEIEKGFIKCYAIDWESSDKHEKRLLDMGLIENWVTDKLLLASKKENIFEDGEDIRDITIIKYGGRYFTARSLENEAKADYETGKRMYIAGHIGNASSQIHDAFKKLNAAKVSGEDLKKDYLENIADQFAERYKHSDPTYFREYVNAV